MEEVAHVSRTTDFRPQNVADGCYRSPGPIFHLNGSPHEFNECFRLVVVQHGVKGSPVATGGTLIVNSHASLAAAQSEESRQHSVRLQLRPLHRPAVGTSA